MWDIGPRHIEKITVALLVTIAMVSVFTALTMEGWAQSALFFGASIASGGALARWPYAFPAAERRKATDRDFDG